MNSNDKKEEAGPSPKAESQAPQKEAFGFKLGQKTLQMTITATQVRRVEPDDDDDDSGLGIFEVKYHLRWEGITGQGMEKDVTVRFVQSAPEGTEEVMLQYEMMALMLEAKRRFVD